ncbi:MAG: glycerophosphodiester phosphodiesterase [Betaproteobacteria bacterium]|nr:MAG: glycerophosphodiester phosphodiesterase [Betaproteobacteria bacterium]
MMNIARTAMGAMLCLSATATVAGEDYDSGPRNVQLGTRPYYLIEGLKPGELKDRLQKCSEGPFRTSSFSIGHRGAAQQYPEHTKEAYQAGARMGAGIVECDTTFTKDGALVCRHDECDLATTTNIVATPLNAKCTVPWSGPNSSPQCCTSDLTLAEFKSLRGKMDASTPGATTPQGFLAGTPSWRTDLNTGRGTLMTLAESIALNEHNGVKHTPELKFPVHPDRVRSVFGGQEQYAQAMIDELRAAHVDPDDVFLQSFNKDDILYWLRHAPEFGKQAVYLDSIDPTATPPVPGQTFAEMVALYKAGGRYFAPPFPALLTVSNGKLVASQYARDIKRAGFKIITWTLERSDLRKGASQAGFYYYFDPAGQVIKTDSDVYIALDVLARDVGIVGIFSDWPATVTYYANCTGLN